MSNLENSIKDCIEKELEKGVIEKVIAAKLEECIEGSMKDMFGWSGEVREVIENKIKSVMIPYLEGYDYSKYITKLDHVLVEVLKSTTLENKTLLENFKELMSTSEIPKEVKISDIYEKWQEYCSKNVDTYNLEEECGEYQYLEVSLNVEGISSDWSDFEKNIVTFECEQDKNMNVEFELTRWKKDSDKKHRIDYEENHTVESLRHLSEFDIYMMRLNQNYVKVDIDIYGESDEIDVEAKPYE